MPDFDRLHEHAQKLAALTAPGQQEPGLASWCTFVGETWKAIAEMWKADPKRVAAEDLYVALEAMLRCENDHGGIGGAGICIGSRDLAHKAIAKARGEQANVR